MAKNKWLNIKFTITFTNLTGFAIICFGLYNSFNISCMTVGSGLMLGRKTKWFNN